MKSSLLSAVRRQILTGSIAAFDVPKGTASAVNRIGAGSKLRTSSHLFLLAAVTCIAAAATAKATDIYWDSNGATAGAGTAPTGNWGTDAFWSSDATGASATVATWNSGDTAVFSAGSDATSPYTITLNADTAAAGLKFEEGNVTFVSTTSAKNLTVNSNLDLTLGARTVFFGNATAATTVNLLLGSNSLTLNSGSLELYGNNTMASALLKSGTAIIGNANAFGTTGTVTMGDTAANSTVQLRMRSVTLSRPIVLQSGTGFTTNATLNNVGFLSPIVTGGITSTGSGTTNLTIDSIISGSGSSLTFTVSGANPINHTGTLTLRNTGTGTASPTGTLDISAPIGSNVTTVTVSDTSGGVKGLQRVILGNTGNAWTGATTINSPARLELSASEVIPDGSGKGNVTVNGTLDLRTATGDSTETINGLSGSGTITRSGASGTSTLVVGGNDAGGTFSGTLQNSSGTLALTKTGSGTLTLSGTNTYTGNTLVSQGILALGSNTALQNSALDTSGAGTVSVTGFTTPTLGGLTGSVNLASVITTGYSSVTALTLNPLAGSQTYSGVIANGTMTLTKTGAGTQILSGSAANTYTGLTTVSAGTLSVAKTGGAITIAGDILINGTGILSTTANVSGRIADSSNVTVDGASAQFQFGSNQNDTINTLAVNNGGTVAIATDGLSNLRPNGGITSTGGGSITGTASQRGLDFNGGVRTVTVTDSTLAIGVSITNGGLTKQGAGMLILNGSASNYTGNTLVSQGILALGSNTALQNSALDTSGAGTVSVTGFTTPTLGGLTGSVNLASVITTGYSSVTALTLNPLAGSQTYSGVIANGTMTLTKTGAGTQTLSGASANTYTGLTTVSAGTLSLDKNDGVTAISGNILVNGTGILSTTINKSGRIADTSNVTVDGASAQFQVGYNQNDTINTLAVNNGGRVILGEAGGSFYALLGTNAGITSTGGGSIRFTNSALNQTGLDFKGGIRTVDVADNTLTLDVGITNGGLTKIGNGTLALNGASNYTGPTTITGGTLNLSGGLSGTTNVQLDGGSLLLSGAAGEQVRNAATVALNGGTLGFNNAANQIETLSTLTLSANSKLDFGASGGNDSFRFAAFPVHTQGGGTLTIDNWAGNLAGGNGLGGDVDGLGDRLVFLGDVTAPGSFANVFNQSDVSFTSFGPGFAAIAFGATSYEIVPIPEPSSTALIGGAALLGLVGYRERRRIGRLMGQGTDCRSL